MYKTGVHPFRNLPVLYPLSIKQKSHLVLLFSFKHALSPHGWTLLSSGVQATRPVHPRRSTAPFAICFSGEPTAGSIMLDTLSCLGSSDVAFSGFCCYAQRSVSSTCRVNIGDVAQDSASLLSPRPAPVGQPAL